MKFKKPLISVIIPVYNCERYLPEAIESVLAQTYRPIEIIVVDDGSTDNSGSIAKGFGAKVRYYFQPNSGVSAALNQGIESAKGSFFAFLDADDLWVEDKLMHQMTVFEKDPDLDIVFGHVKQFYTQELCESLKETISISQETAPGFFKGTMLIKREAFERVGLFESAWRMGDFIDWYARAMEQKLKSFMLPDVVLKRRIHDANMGIRERNARGDYLRILKASLDRRRKIRPI